MITYQVVLFDADGTLMDFRRAEEYALRRAFEALSLPYDEDRYVPVYREVNERLWNGFERGEISSAQLETDRFSEFLESVGIRADGAQFGARYLEALGNADFLIDGALEAVGALSEYCRMSVVTNGLSRVQNSRFARSELRRYFDRIIISDEIGSRKPEPQIFEIAMKAYPGVNRKEVLMVGDSLKSDIAGGMAYGVHTCWFNPAGMKRTGDDVVPDFEIRDLADLLPLLHQK